MKNLKSLLLLFLFVVAATTATRAQQVFVANLSGAQEVPAVASSGRGVCQAVLNAAQTQLTVNCNYSGLTSNATAANIRGGAFVGGLAGVMFDFGAVSGTSGTISPPPFTLTADQLVELRWNRMYVNIQTANHPSGEIRGQLHVANAIFDDYDGDGRTDPTVFRASTGTWYSLLSLTNSLKAQQWGTNGDLKEQNPDFDGDGISDIAVRRINQASGQYHNYILQSATNTLRAVDFGSAVFGDQMASGDFDGDGKYDLGIFRSGLWAYIESSTGTVRYFNWGRTGDIANEGDYDRDGKSDFAVYRTVSDQIFWYIRLSSTGALKTVQLGQTGNIVLSRSDFDGDGASDTTIARDTNNGLQFVTVRSSDGATRTQLQGDFNRDIPRSGDFDGDGKHDYTIIISRFTALYWVYIRSFSDPRSPIQIAVQWGRDGDR